MDVFIAKSAESPARAPSGRFYKSGKAKSVGCLAYGAEFGRIAREHKIAHPTQYCAD
ncbi:hypothetical protein [Sabulicella rubraurantiaca]|uniref:hypothetical protein n=1 Tax=Sabulicella rubraurantiaca TaxID=2811429 RepID=UPI001A970803|nr:hypothetical protein [Sabulicella rubraurantiaca]